MQSLENTLATIRNFRNLPPPSLALLSKRLGLRMSRAELAFCAKHYRGKGAADDISIEELCLIDALACPTYPRLSKIAIGELLTNHEDVAQTYRDLINKLGALGRDPQKPITLQDVANASERYIHAMSGHSITEPIGIGGNHLSYAAHGLYTKLHLDCTDGGIDLLETLPIHLKGQAEYADALVLLSPLPETAAQEYCHAVVSLLSDPLLGQHIHCIGDCTQKSIAHTVLSVSDGAVLNLAKLPEEMQSLDALTTCTTATLLALPQSMLEAFVARAADCEILLSYFGIVDHAGYLIIRNGKTTILNSNVGFLKSICFIRSYTLRLKDENDWCNFPDAVSSCVQLHTLQEALPEDADPTEPVLRTMPPLRAHAAARVNTARAPYHSAMLCAAQAYCTAVAAGCDPSSITLHARLFQADHSTISTQAADALASLLGLYRFSMEMAVPVHTEVDFNEQESGTLVLANAPSDLVIPAHFSGNGRVYLLKPLYQADTFPVWEDVNAMISYLRTMMLQGKISAARSLGDKTVQQALDLMSQKGHAAIINPDLAALLQSRFPCAFLVEGEDGLTGDLIAVTER